jgi:uracil-DNA glycosylase
MNGIALPDGWEDFFTQHSALIDRILDTIIQSSVSVTPDPGLVFDMFYRIHPGAVRLMLVGQDPYAGQCPVTSTAYACGIAFAIPDACQIIPPALQNIAVAVLKPNEYIVDKQLDSWIAQGAFLANMGWTRGRDVPDDDMRSCHILLWEEFSRHLVKWLCEHNDKIVFGLIGARAWVLAEEVVRKDLVVKCSDRDLRAAFKKINELIHSAYGESIRWNTISQSRS